MVILFCAFWIAFGSYFAPVGYSQKITSRRLLFEIITNSLTNITISSGLEINSSCRIFRIAEDSGVIATRLLHRKRHPVNELIAHLYAYGTNELLLLRDRTEFSFSFGNPETVVPFYRSRACDSVLDRFHRNTVYGGRTRTRSARRRIIIIIVL